LKAYIKGKQEEDIYGEKKKKRKSCGLKWLSDGARGIYRGSSKMNFKFIYWGWR